LLSSHALGFSYQYAIAQGLILVAYGFDKSAGAGASAS
jgi:hypothetical protein